MSEHATNEIDLNSIFLRSLNKIKNVDISFSVYNTFLETFVGLPFSIKIGNQNNLKV